MTKLFKTLGLIWVIAGMSFFIWMYISFDSRGFDESILESDNEIEVDMSDNLISFVPKSRVRGKVFFYPGALVDPLAYSPLCRKLAENGYETKIVRMPMRLASLGYKLIKDRGILDGEGHVTLIGHSQGGKMAARFVYENPASIENLVLLATTHPRDFDLSGRNINVLKIFGSEDGVANREKIVRNMPKLPMDTQYFEIDGGNHSNFGFYGTQLGDNGSSTTRKEQLDLTVSKILEFLDSKGRKGKRLLPSSEY